MILQQTFRYFAIIIFALVLAACNDNAPFIVDGEVEGLGTQNLTVLYRGDGGTHQQMVPVVDSRFSFEGFSHSPTVVELMLSNKTVIGRFVAKNGDKLKISFKVDDNAFMEIKGDKIAERYADFMRQNASSPAAKRRAIEKYIGSYPDDFLSGVLLAYEYDLWEDPSRTDSLISLIGRGSDAYRMVADVADMIGRVVVPAQPIESLKLLVKGDSVADLRPSAEGRTLYWFDEGHTLHDSVKQALSGADASIVYVRCRIDTFGWGRSAASLPKGSLSGWAPEGVASEALLPLGLPSLPFAIVTDSVGQQLLRTPRLIDAVDFKR